MSLNGLDDAKVVEAHEFAAAEPGGWFLLKYANRDEVELLDRGNGGIVDIRGAIAKYDETSPLYGFLRYRRRNVLIKYQPDDCSRLVQARAAVHFNAICERFMPYDTIFEISVAKDLKDSKLSAACSLHAASGSASSSSSSLRRRRLNEIAEEEEEEERERKRQSTVKEEERRTSSVYSVPGQPSAEHVAVLDRQQISSPPKTDFASTTDVPEFTGADRPTSPTKSESAPRLSLQSTRPELYGYSSYAYGKARVKLGPRPSLDITKRPATAGNFRPIAALPAGFKFFSKGSKKGHSGDAEHSEKTEETEQTTPDVALTTTLPIPEIPQDTGHQLPPRPATSSGASMKSITTSLAPQPTKEAKMTPEKARLIKAMKLREKRMNSAIVEQTIVSETLPINGKKESNAVEPKSSLRIQEDVNQRTVSHADSGIAVDPPTPMTAHTEDTVSDSHPNSPTAATSSEIGVSTKASSLSESTDETVQATKDEGEEDEGILFREEPDLVLEIEDPRESAVGITLADRSGRAEASRSGMRDTNVLDVRDARIPKESNEIPASNPQTSEEHSIRESIEVDDPVELTLQTRVQGVGQPTTEEDTPKSPWGLPVSKFSSNEPNAPTSPKSTGPSLKSKFSIPDLAISAEPVPALPVDTTAVYSPEERESSLGTNPEIRLSIQKSAKRKAAVEAIRTDLAKTTPLSESSDPLLDDALMDELQSATLQEAKPMLVSKSPITSLFPHSNPLKAAPLLSRTVSNPMRGPLLVPGDVSQSSARSVSAGGAAFLHTITRQSSNAGLQAKKSNIGSSISQRIKALEKLSSTPSTEDLRPRTAAPASTFFSVRKQSIRDSSKSPSVAERADSLTRHTPTPERSREGTPETPSRHSRERSLSVASRLTMFENQSQNAPRGRPESIQVTARIIRDPSQSLPRKAEVNNSPGDYPQLELKQSPLIVDLQRVERAQTMYEPYQAPAEPPKDTIQERRDRKSISEESEKKRRRSSLSIVKDFIKDRRASIASKSTDNLAIMSPTGNGAKSPSRPPSTHQNSGSFTHRLSISSRRSSFNRERDTTTSPPVISPTVLSDSGSGDDNKSNKSKKRASRFIRRLSNSLGGGRKNTSPSISPTVAEEDADQVAAASTTNVSVSSQPAVVAYMGDVNVQFPDNLLWKRRSMCLDTQGYLFLSAVQGVATNGKDKTAGIGVKRYHLSDFRTPYIPDVEVQELPNSVVLDLMEGSCLQLACEDRAGQLNILHTLQDAHQTHLGQ
ncbi:hypothetical protein F4818DRAFT_320350 [Hypoxylon cercidicola]|nr:hypothetical protein F4818DRAFT_320350 [Hypoxylon cercidicola]